MLYQASRMTLLTAFLSLGSLTSCTSAEDSQSASQTIRISTPGVEGAYCEAADAAGNIYSVNSTPGPIAVRLSHGELNITCRKSGFEDGILTISPLGGHDEGFFDGISTIFGSSSASSQKEYYPKEVVIAMLPVSDIISPYAPDALIPADNIDVGSRPMIDSQNLAAIDSSGMPRSDLPRSDLPRSNMPRSNMPRSNMPRSNLPPAYDWQRNKEAPGREQSSMFNSASGAGLMQPQVPSKTYQSPRQLHASSPVRPTAPASNMREQLPAASYSIQVGAFRNQQNADRLVNRLISEGYRAFLIPSGLTKVRVGSYRDRRSAAMAARTLAERENLPVIVVINR